MVKFGGNVSAWLAHLILQIQWFVRGRVWSQRFNVLQEIFLNVKFSLSGLGFKGSYKTHLRFWHACTSVFPAIYVVKLTFRIFKWGLVPETFFSVNLPMKPLSPNDHHQTPFTANTLCQDNGITPSSTALKQTWINFSISMKTSITIVLLAFFKISKSFCRIVVSLKKLINNLYDQC